MHEEQVQLFFISHGTQLPTANFENASENHTETRTERFQYSMAGIHIRTYIHKVHNESLGGNRISF